MPKFVINCYTSTAYWLTVEAPSREAAETWYDRCDAGAFHKGQEDGWELSDIYQDDAVEADVTVDAEGKVLDA